MQKSDSPSGLSLPLPVALRRQLKAAFLKEQRCRLPSLPLAAVAFLAWELRRIFKRALVLVAANAVLQDDLLRSLAALGGQEAAALLSFAARSPRRHRAADSSGERLQVLSQLQAGLARPLLVTCEQALAQPVPAADLLRARSLHLRLAEEYDPQALLSALEALGYAPVPEVQFRSQVALRGGGLLDIWPSTARAPLRLEFFGTKIESMRLFDAADQRSFARQTSVSIPPADELILLRNQPQARSSLSTYLPAETIYFWLPPENEPAAAGRAAALPEVSEALANTAQIQQELAAQPAVWQCLAGADSAGADFWRAAPMLEPGFQALDTLGAPPRRLFEPDIFAAHRQQWLARLSAEVRRGGRVYVFFEAPGARDRFQEEHPATPFHLRLGALPDGFRHPALGLVVLPAAHLTGLRKRLTAAPLARPGRAGGEAITDWLSIEPGELVVHVDHGLGKYLGLYEIEFNGRLQEVLAVEYAEQAKLYVPVAQSHLLSRYIGCGPRRGAYHRLGGKRWLREKAAAAQAVQDLAANMLETQARREAGRGFAFPADTAWQQDFEAAFPYQETVDQERAMQEVKRDMQSARPMDRLICGDVGYGKTEVALRAAFKAVTAGKQVALLVPTTVLAQQHYELFLARISVYPMRVELLSRFRSAKQQAATVRELRLGKVDIVIGTHRLLQADVQFKDLGLVIIDEEQRFGVEHKERLKQVRQLVDVLTLSATPIPRTLYLSLTGARDISMIQTPPKARQPIETAIVKNEDAIVRAALEQELSRGGQAYYLHNRILTIAKVRERLQRLLPTARISIAHGQMASAELARVMRAFAEGAADILLCTTLIESGVDIPNVNTILIDRADRFGLADLYQLRGRVGRANRQAYAYLLTPAHGHLPSLPRRRLRALLEHAELGAGFRLALRDLEIRGAGNLLGAEQSGYIAAIGFDLYCQLLRRTIAQLSGQAVLPPVLSVELALDFIDLSTRAPLAEGAAFLPADYVEDERLRLGIYRQIAAASTEQEIQALREELRDRFGQLPLPLERLLQLAALRILAAARNISSIETRANRLMLKRGGEYLMRRHHFPRLKATQADERLQEIRAWLAGITPAGLSG